MVSFIRWKLNWPFESVYGKSSTMISIAAIFYFQNERFFVVVWVLFSGKYNRNLRKFNSFFNNLLTQLLFIYEEIEECSFGGNMHDMCVYIRTLIILVFWNIFFFSTIKNPHLLPTNEVSNIVKQIIKTKLLVNKCVFIQLKWNLLTFLQNILYARIRWTRYPVTHRPNCQQLIHASTAKNTGASAKQHLSSATRYSVLILFS